MASRLLVDVAGQLKADGTGFILMDNPVNSWCKASMALQSANSPNAQWTFGVGRYTGGANPVLPHVFGFGVGGSAVAGPYIMAPREVLMCKVTGGTASDSISGTVFGLQEIDPSDLVDLGAVAGSVTASQIIGNVNASVNGSVTTTAPQKYVTRVNGINGGVTVSVALPAGTQSIGIPLSGVGWTFNHVKISGVQSGFVYYESYRSVQPAQVLPIFFGWDTSLNILVDGAYGAVDVIAMFQPAAEFLQFYQPPWYAPNQPPLYYGNANITSGGNIQILPPTANIKPYPFDFHVTALQVGGTGRIAVNLNAGLTLGTSSGIDGWTSNAGQISDHSSFGGSPLTAGHGLWLVNNSASGVTIEAYGRLTYSLS